MKPPGPPKDDEIEIVPRSSVDATVTVPSSKSLTNRALALAALAAGRSVIEAPLLADDTIRMVRALRALGVRVEPIGSGRKALEEVLASPSGASASDGTPSRSSRREDAAHATGGAPATGGALAVSIEAFEVSGNGGSLKAPGSALDVGGSGTAMRFLTALSSLAQGDVRLDGDARMRQRPIELLLEALRSLGVEARSEQGNGCPPVRVRGGTLSGGTVRIRGDVSSQFVSALLMIAPLAPGAVEVVVLPPVASRPYIDLTLRVMRVFGVTGPPDHGPALSFRFPGGLAYHAARYRVPPDASSASYFLAAAAAAGGRLRVRGLRRDDSQGDITLLEHLEGMGCEVTKDDEGTTVARAPGVTLRAFDLDLVATPDLVPTLAVLALFADGPSTIRNVANLRLKESDRLSALATELRRVGADVEELADGLLIVPRPLHGARIETYRDHRIAMAFAVAGLLLPGVRIADPDCVAKSFPGFWDAWAALGG